MCEFKIGNMVLHKNKKKHSQLCHWKLNFQTKKKEEEESKFSTNFCAKVPVFSKQLP